MSKTHRTLWWREEKESHTRVSFKIKYVQKEYQDKKKIIIIIISKNKFSKICHYF